MPPLPSISLIIPYRQRQANLITQLAWWKQQFETISLEAYEVLLVEVDETPSNWLLQALSDTPIRYIHCPCRGIFHKTKALNQGLQHAKGPFIAPLDVDLIPIADTLTRHLLIAERSPQLLVTGYRVMHTSETVDLAYLPTILEHATIAPEDQPTALWKHLVRAERFGVVPLFERDRLLSIGGWDEQFIGWGGEDQDIIERYLQHDRYLCRCPDLVYLHLAHDRNRQWAEAALVEQNRRHYYTKLQHRQTGTPHFPS